jgi:hypothetical protein
VAGLADMTPETARTAAVTAVAAVETSTAAGISAGRIGASVATITAGAAIAAEPPCIAAVALRAAGGGVRAINNPPLGCSAVPLPTSVIEGNIAGVAAGTRPPRWPAHSCNPESHAPAICSGEVDAAAALAAASRCRFR